MEIYTNVVMQYDTKSACLVSMSIIVCMLTYIFEHIAWIMDGYIHGDLLIYYTIWLRMNSCEAVNELNVGAYLRECFDLCLCVIGLIECSSWYFWRISQILKHQPSGNINNTRGFEKIQPKNILMWNKKTQKKNYDTIQC